MNDIQSYINKLISWYSIKFSDHYLKELQNKKSQIDSTLVKTMNFEALQKRYTTFEKELFLETDVRDGKIILQKRLVIAAGWGLIYHKNTSPQYGYYRATQLLQDFNACFGWNLSPKIYKSVFEREYSLNNLEVVQLLNKKKKQKRERKEEESNKRKRSFGKRLIKKRIHN